MKENGNVEERYEIAANCDESWNDFVHRYQADKVDIALETSTSGK
jgi:hypothetical protein